MAALIEQRTHRGHALAADSVHERGQARTLAVVAMTSPYLMHSKRISSVMNISILKGNDDGDQSFAQSKSVKKDLKRTLH